MLSNTDNAAVYNKFTLTQMTREGRESQRWENHLHLNGLCSMSIPQHKACLLELLFVMDRHLFTWWIMTGMPDQSGLSYLHPPEGITLVQNLKVPGGFLQSCLPRRLCLFGTRKELEEFKPLTNTDEYLPWMMGGRGYSVDKKETVLLFSNFRKQFLLSFWSLFKILAAILLHWIISSAFLRSCDKTNKQLNLYKLSGFPQRYTVELLVKCDKPQQTVIKKINCWICMNKIKDINVNV